MKVDLHIIAYHAAEPHLAFWTDSVGGKGDVMAHSTDGLGDVGWI